MSTFQRLWVVLHYLPFWQRLRACLAITAARPKRKNRP